MSLPETITSTDGTELVSLARRTVEQCARGADPSPPDGDDTDVPAVGCGAFVTLERGEELRGCCGRPDPSESLPAVVVDAAVDAARNDPRCPPVRPAELDEIAVSVTVLSTPTPIGARTPAEYRDAVDVGRHGLVVEAGRARGLLLPQVAVERDWDAAGFLTATCLKAGLPGDAWRRDDVTVKRFTARAFTERRPRGDVDIERFEQRAERPADDEDEESVTPDTDERDDGDESGTGGADLVPDGGKHADDVRTPAVAGQFYASGEGPLREQLDDCREHEYGPGDEGRRDAGRPTTLVVPHAGYPYSGPVAAHGYALLATGPSPETVVVFGPNHDRVGPDAAVAPHECWRTPLGDLPVDADLATAIVEASETATFDARAHAGEHSVEVQLPFLQHCLDDWPSVVPVCTGRLGRERAERLGRTVAAAIDRTTRDALVVSSTDLTHYEPHEAAVAADEPMLDALETLDIDAIARLVEGGHTMCGPWATVAGLTAARERGVDTATRLQYATSGQTAGPSDRVVGYCSLAVR